MFVGVWRHATMLRGAALMLMALALASTVSGCGLISVKTVGRGPASTLQCAQNTVGHSVDVVNVKVTCQASGAAGGDTSFKLHYTIKNSDGAVRDFDATCDGALQDGKGSCSQTYALVAPFDSDSAQISGEFFPSHKLLGPMPLPLNN